MARRTEQLKITVFFNFLQNRTRPSFFPHHVDQRALSRCAATNVLHGLIADII
jgi:hypothetical protein